MQFQIGEPIPIGVFRASNNGSPQNNQATSVNVFNLETGLLELSAQPLSQAQSFGFYRFVWSPNFTTPKTLLAVIYSGTDTSGTILTSYLIRVVDNVKLLTDTIDLSDGRAI